MNDLSAALQAPSPWFLTAPPDSVPKSPPRPRILALLDEAISTHPITLLAAPSGYDKSNLLASWKQKHPASSAWLTLTRHEHNDEELLLAGILSALDRIRRGSAVLSVATAQVSSGQTARATIGRVVEAFSALDEDIVLIIDDAHHAGPVLAHGVVDLLANLGGGRLRFVLAGSPQLRGWFARALSVQQAVLITGSELALTTDEVRTEYAFWDTPIDENEAASIIASSAGWPIAVRLHRLSKGVEVPSLPPQPAGDSGARMSPLLTDYIAENVLAQLQDPLEEFILAATTCSFLSAPLAQALTGEAESGALLEECVSLGLFLDRYPDEKYGIVYRWNEEFAVRCREILARTRSTRGQALHTIAARWLAPHFPTEAIMHALRAENPDLAVDIIRAFWLRVIVESGARVLNAQCLTLPTSLGNHPEILAIRAACLNLLGDLTGSRLLIAQATATGGTDPQFAATHAFASLFLADDPIALTDAADHAREAMTHATIDPSLNAYRLFLLGWVELRLRRNPPAAISLLESAVGEAEAGSRPILARRARGNLLFALSYGGRFTQARALMDAGSDDEPHGDDWLHYDGGISQFAEGFVDYWQGQTLDAQRTFLRLCEDGGHDASYAALARVYLAFCAADDGSPDAIRSAHSHLDGISAQQLHGVPWPAYRAIAEAELFAASGDLSRAIRALEAVGSVGDIPVVRAAAAEILRRDGRLAEASQLLGGISAAARRTSYVVTSVSLTGALIAHEIGDSGRSGTLFERALNAAAPEGILQPFRIRDARYRQLLTAHASSGTAHSEFIASRITAFDAANVERTTLGVALSAREQEVFGYLCTTMTAEEIAAALFVSVNTIRTHQRAIYRKLGVSTRRDAIRFRL